MLNPKNELKDLEKALTKYKLFKIKVMPRNRDFNHKVITENLENKILNFTEEEEEGLTFYIDNKKFFNFSLEKNHHNFRIEYQNEKESRLWNENYSPEDPKLPKPTYSTLRKILDEFELAIYFKGKIKIEQDNKEKDFWKIK
jgi:hypothetical protein